MESPLQQRATCPRVRARPGLLRIRYSATAKMRSTYTASTASGFFIGAT